MVGMEKLGIFITQYSLLVYLLISKEWHDTKFVFSGSRISAELIRKMSRYVNVPVSGYYTERIGEMIKKHDGFARRDFFRINVFSAISMKSDFYRFYSYNWAIGFFSY